MTSHKIIFFLFIILLVCLESTACNILFKSIVNIFRSEVKCETSEYPPPKSSVIPWFTVDLDENPDHRWKQVISSHITGIKNLLTQFIKMLDNFGLKILLKYIDDEFPKLVPKLPKKYSEELLAISELSGIKLGEVVLLNVFYEIFTVCTSIIAHDSKGLLYHARNLDFGLMPAWDWQNKTWAITEALRPIVINVRYIRGSKIVFESTTFAGYVGVFTGLKPNKFSLTVNERFNIDGGYIGIIDWLLFHPNDHWMGFLTRDLLEDETSFEGVKQKLITLPLIAPAYFIIGGVNPVNGAIITRARKSTKSVVSLGGNPKTPWYILQTNYDPWVSPPFWDNRRGPGNFCMQQISNVSVKSLFNVLSTRPVLNRLTVYTAVMCLNDGGYESYIQTCQPPCPIW